MDLNIGTATAPTAPQVADPISSLENVLSDFEIDICPWKNPADWLHSDIGYVTSAVQKFILLPDKSKIEAAILSGSMIYKVHYIISRRCDPMH